MTRRASLASARWEPAFRWYESRRPDRFEATITFRFKAIAGAFCLAIPAGLLVCFCVVLAGDPRDALAFGASYALGAFVLMIAWTRHRTRMRTSIVVTAEQVTVSFVEPGSVPTALISDVQTCNSSAPGSGGSPRYSVRIRAGGGQVSCLPAPSESLTRRRAERLSGVIRAFQAGPYRGEPPMGREDG